MNRIIFFIGMLSLASFGFSQTTLNLLDGNQIKLVNYTFHSVEGYMEYSYLKPNGKLKTTYDDLPDVYSISINGKDSIIYSPYNEEEFSLIDMTQVVNAKQFALVEYKPWWAFTTSLAVGCGSMFLPLGATTKLMIPIVYTAGMAFMKPSKSYITKRHETEEYNELFMYGYKSTGRRKIIKNTFLGTVSGIFVAGIIVGTLKIVEGD
jgi:hypothetical protein